MRDRVYCLGVCDALMKLGMTSGTDDHGKPFSKKNPTINAERLAEMFQQDDEHDERPRINPENHSYAWDRPVTWQSGINLSGLAAGQSMSGVITPGNTRG